VAVVLEALAKQLLAVPDQVLLTLLDLEAPEYYGLIPV
jgi:hypothetical protein